MALVYYLTPGGKDALREEDGAAKLPLEYRRLLALMELEGHIDVIRGRLRRFPDQLIEEWLKELLDLEAWHHTRTGQTEDHKEAAKAFVEKREPTFKGR